MSNAKLEQQLFNEYQKQILTALAKFEKKEKGTQKELLAKLNLASPEYRRIKSGRANLTLKTVSKLMAILKAKVKL